MNDLEENGGIREEKSTNVRENLEAKDTNVDAAEYIGAKENIDVAEDNIKVNSKRNVNGKGLVAATSVAVVAIVSYSVISSSGLINLNMDGKINEISFVDDGIDYDIKVSNMKSSNYMYFDIILDNTSLHQYKITETIKSDYSGDLKGHVSLSEIGLADRFEQSGALTYTVRLCGNTGLLDRTYDSWLLEVNGATSTFNSVKYKCDCSNSGYFLFTMDYTDNFSMFTGFRASLSDTSGNVSKCIFTNNWREEQKIFALDLDGTGVTFKIEVNKNNKVDSDGNLVYEEVYTREVEL